MLKYCIGTVTFSKCIIKVMLKMDHFLEEAIYVKMS